MPSSRKPSMLQVLTNSSTCFGRSVICVSRSEQWMTLTPRARARWLNWPVRLSSAMVSAARPLARLSAMSFRPMSTRPCLTKWEMSPGLAPCSMTAVAPGVFHFAVSLRRFMWRQ